MNEFGVDGKLCIFVDANCGNSEISTQNNLCTTVDDFIITHSGTVFGYKYLGVVNSINKNNNDLLSLYSDSDCTSANLLQSIDLSGLGNACQNDDVFINGNRFRSWKVC